MGWDLHASESPKGVCFHTSKKQRGRRTPPYSLGLREEWKRHINVSLAALLTSPGHLESRHLAYTGVHRKRRREAKFASGTGCAS